ncbi:hypothetical protein S245_021890 [Arachis hypogaea]
MDYSKIIFIFLLLGLAIIAQSFVNHGGSFSKQKVLEVENKLRHLRRHSLKTIKSEDGDIIDCIDLNKQPAFDHPALKNHKIQMAPTKNSAKKEPIEWTKSRSKTKDAEDSLSLRVLTSQIWKKSGTCPEGTIPIRRIRKNDMLKAPSIEEYGRKKPSFSPSRQVHENLDSYVPLRNHSKAILFAVGFRYLGAKADINVCWPFVEKDDEFSTAQISLLTGSYIHFESVQSGWAVNPRVYGDRQTRVFVYWTADGSNKTGCFDLTCPGFVQTSKEIALGAAIYPIIPVPGDLPYDINIYIYKDILTNNWWVQYGEKTNIGYWPAELFETLCYNADSVEWGGEVYSSKILHYPHTKTNMGNGKFGSQPYSAYFKRMRIHDNSESLKFPEYVDRYSDEYNCYDVRFLGDYVEDPELYYGGPGSSDYNYMCL